MPSLTKRAFTVMTEVISFGSRALFVSPRKMRKTMPKGFSSVFEGVLTTGRSLDDPFLGSDADASC